MLLLFLTASVLGLSSGQDDGFYYDTFPENFLFGCASSTYQIEGGWNASGKGMNIWDKFTHEHPESIADHNNGDVACDSYHNYQEDVRILKEMGAQFYRFSLSWSRILPTGYIDFINPDGIDYYNNLINELLDNDIQPMITLFHGDLPQPLQDLGGWPNPVLVDYFGDFARVAFREFGDRVKMWITINEPYYVSTDYATDGGATGVNAHGIGEYLSGHTLLKSHALAYHIYDSEFKEEQQGEVGITISMDWPEAKAVEYEEDAERARQFMFGWFGHPIYSEEGDYPPVMREYIDRNSFAEGRNRSRLPTFTQEEIDYIKGTGDFLGFNHYTTFLIEPGETGEDPSINRDQGVIKSQDPSWPGEGTKLVPESMRKQLNWVTNQYNTPKVYITENGYGDSNPTLNDTYRVTQVTNYLDEVLKAIKLDGCDVRAYAAWSLMDNFEWMSGFSTKFGLYRVDFDDPARPRTPKQSSTVYTDIIRNRGFPEPSRL